MYKQAGRQKIMQALKQAGKKAGMYRGRLTGKAPVLVSGITFSLTSDYSSNF
jgi:hypothetical protein